MTDNQTYCRRWNVIRTGLKCEASGMSESRFSREWTCGPFEACRISRPDVVLMDIPHAKSNREGTGWLRGLSRVKVADCDDLQDYRICRSRAKWCLGVFKDSPEAILDGIKVAMSGKVVMDQWFRGVIDEYGYLRKPASFECGKMGAHTAWGGAIQQVA